MHWISPAMGGLAVGASSQVERHARAELPGV